jgi:rSAM/selenodomain-associated transferase 2
MDATTAERISVIIPAWNEAARIGRAVESSVSVDGVDAWVVDGGSRDRTIEVAESQGANVLRTERGRALQMNAGARASAGSILVFLHADAVLPAGFDAEVRAALSQPGVSAGAFALSIEDATPSLGIIARAANWRARRLQMPYGDQALFVRRKAFESVGGFPEIPLMEDLELVRRLRREGRIAISSLRVVASARRWRRLGPVRCTLINQLAIAGYFLGLSPDRLAGWYGRDGIRENGGRPPA